MRRIITGLLTAGLCGLVLGVTPAAAAAPTGTEAAAAPTDPATATESAAAPQLSIEIDNGKTSVLAGDTLTYTITLQNLGTTDISGLQITQTVPAGLLFGAADNGGTVQDGAVSWTLDLPSTAASTLQTTMTVTDTPAELLRLASVACATVDGTDAPLVCASHSDQLPAGAAAESAASNAAGATTPSTESSSPRWAIIGGVILVLLVGAGAALLIRRRRV